MARSHDDYAGAVESGQEPGITPMKIEAERLNRGNSPAPVIVGTLLATLLTPRLPSQITYSWYFVFWL